jgi:hypothetical protein
MIEKGGILILILILIPYRLVQLEWIEISLLRSFGIEFFFFFWKASRLCEEQPLAL